jgi:hypothetical protein
MSDRYNPKKVLKARAAAIAAGATPDPVLRPEPPRAQATAAMVAAWTPVLADTTCRLHGQPWRSCTECSKPRARRA